jgi:hypothetical protein
VAAASGHECGRDAADICAVGIEPDAFGHFGDITFRKAGSGAVIACGGASVARLNARLMLLVCHETSVRRRIAMGQRNGSASGVPRCEPGRISSYF